MARPRRTKPGVEVATAEKMAEALRLRGDEHMTYAQIGARLGLSDERARQLVAKALEDMVAEPAKSARNFELRRMRAAAKHLEAVLVMAEPKELGSLVGSLVRVSERIARLQGLDAPTKLDVREKPLGAYSVEELQQMLSEAKAHGA